MAPDRAGVALRERMARDGKAGSDPMSDTMSSNTFIELTAHIVSAYVSNNSVSASDIPNLISQIHSALLRVSGDQARLSPNP